MSNKFESFRTQIKAELVKCVVKHSQDKTSVSYNWSFGRACNEVGKACGLTDTVNLPAEFKDILRFEFNKLKTDIMSTDKWTHTRSRESFVFSNTHDQIIKKRNDTYELSAITIEVQLEQARRLVDKVGTQLSKAETEEKRHTLKMRQKKLLKEVDFLTKQIELNKQLACEVNGAKLEVKSEEKQTA